MKHDFCSLFGRLPPTLMRHEDGTVMPDRSHPLVQSLVQAIESCRDAGDSEEQIQAIVKRGIAEGFKRLEAKDGTPDR